MNTNILEVLHTTAAYQSAAMQLMVNEANFVAKQLDLKETVPPIVMTDTNRWEVDPPTSGVGGGVASENYFFYFHQGKLQSVRKRDWFQKITPPANDMFQLADRPCLLDTNSAFELAKQRLASISIDVAEMETKFPPNVFQPRGQKRDASGQRLSGPTNVLAIPLFMIGWGEGPMNSILRERFREMNRPLPQRQRPPSSDSPVFVEFLGTTRELLELSVREPSLLKRPALQVANAAELLGPIPPPQAFVEKLVGGKEAYRTLAEPDKVEAWLLAPYTESGDRLEKKDRTGPRVLKPEIAREFSNALLAFDSYSWGIGGSKMCMPDYGARLRFTRGKDVVDVRLCYECDILEITHGSKQELADFDSARDALVRALQKVFPNDQVVKDLKLDRP